jgi:hypothetical protein
VAALLDGLFEDAASGGEDAGASGGEEGSEALGDATEGATGGADGGAQPEEKGSSAASARAVNSSGTRKLAFYACVAWLAIFR